jgi:hypothetical protein
LLGEKHVNLTADPEFSFQVDSGLEGTGDTGNDETGVMGLQVVKVDAIPVNLLSQVVTGPMDKEFLVAGLPDTFSNHVIHLPTLGKVVSLKTLAQKVHSLITSLAYDLKNFAVPFGYLLAHKACPGDIGIHTVLFLRFGP